MHTFFVKFEVEPTEHNAKSALVKGAFACCLIVAENEPAAYNKALFYVEKDEWEIMRTEIFPTKVKQTQFADENLWLAQYLRAQQEGIAIVYVGWARDGKTTAGPMPVERSRRFDLNSYIGKQKSLARTGRCLHFDNGVRCDTPINAHSIQRKGQLSAIADKGDVYAPSRNITTLKESHGRLTLERYGIGRVSTFVGFCARHDSQLFAPIDTRPLLPTGDQALLYAYRSICRELFVKENALDLIDSQLATLPATSSARRFFEDMRTGMSLGLTNLREHKAAFDHCLKGQSSEDIEYVLFASRQKPFLAFSGLIYTEFDFLGQHLQDVADHTRRLDLLTFCSAAMDSGWGFLFVWHKSSTKTCAAFMSSLATLTCKNTSSGADAMFRLVVSNCENLAVSPAWWEGLAAEQRNAITARLSHLADIFTPTDPRYLAHGIEDICGWHFETVYENPRKPRNQ